MLSFLEGEGQSVVQHSSFLSNIRVMGPFAHMGFRLRISPSKEYGILSCFNMYLEDQRVYQMQFLQVLHDIPFIPTSQVHPKGSGRQNSPLPQ